tara:strand:+ start:461 stop:706 length:246 start_codon:yes stop_codon:yes gene_type:complete
MGGHVIGTLSGVDVEGVSLRHEPSKESLKITLHIRICVLLDEERRRGVMDKDMTEPLFKSSLLNNRCHLSCDLSKALGHGR